MENNINEEFEDALSFCDLPLSESDFSSDHDEFLNSSSSTQDFFEFSTATSSPSHPNSILFCGKLISSKSEFLPNSQDDDRRIINQASNRFLPQRGKNLRCPSSGINGCRKQKVMIGLAKIPSKMDLSDLRERYNRRSINRPPMFPAVVKGGDSTVVSSKGSAGKSRRWALLRPFRCRAQDLAIGSMMARSSSFRCLGLARPCFD